MRTEGFTNAEFGNSNVWFPNSSTGCAAATGCRPCRPKNPAALINGGWVRVLSGGSKCVQAQPARSILSMKRATSCMAARAVWAYNGGTGSGKGFRTRRQLERSPFFVWNLIR